MAALKLTGWTFGMRTKKGFVCFQCRIGKDKGESAVEESVHCIRCKGARAVIPMDWKTPRAA